MLPEERSKIAEKVIKIAQLKKESGLSELARFLATGRSTAFHGTSKALAQQIKKGPGLVPNAKRGITDAIREGIPGVPEYDELVKAMTGSKKIDPTRGQSLAFLTRHPLEAKGYAAQQGIIDVLGTRPLNYAIEKLAPVVRPMMEGPGNPLKGGSQQFKENVVNALKSTIKDKPWRAPISAWQAKRHGVLTTRYPARNIKTVRNPEIEVVKDMLDTQYGPIIKPAIKELPSEYRGLARKGYRGAKELYGQSIFGRTMGLPPQFPENVALPSKYIVGAKDYQRTTLPEIADHLRYAVKNPKDTAMEALRNLTGQNFFTK